MCKVDSGSFEYGRLPLTSIFDSSARSLSVLHFKPPVGAMFILYSSFHNLNRKAMPAQPPFLHPSLLKHK